ncbi:MAG: c-type cytochrome [Anaeromyxobacter sp.]
MKRPLRLVLTGVGALLLVLGLAAGAATLYAVRQFDAKHDLPLPTGFTPARSPEALARGKHLFDTICAQCHVDAKGLAAGQHMADVPEFLGKFYTANLTRHPTGGIGAWSDAELARVIRTGIRRNGRLAIVMPQFSGLSDDDLAAVVGHLRSDDPVFAPVAEPQPPIEGTLVGKLILTFVAGAKPKPMAAHPIVAPPVGPTADYGRYLVKDVLQCGDCHSPGFAGDKSEGKEAFTGGFEFVGARGEKVLSSNLTPDADTGIGRMTEAEFVRALREGVRPDGTPLRPPMAPFRTLDEVEARAVYAWLRTLAPVHHPIPRPAADAPPPGGGVAARFVTLGCVACHGEGAAFREKLRPAAGQPLDEVAARILHPERFNPRSPMPSFAGRVDEAEARSLAAHVQELSRRLPPPAQVADR